MPPVPPPSTPPTGDDSRPLLTEHAAIVLLMAAYFGGIVGILTYLSGSNAAGALVAGLTVFGASAVGLRNVIGR